MHQVASQARSLSIERVVFFQPRTFAEDNYQTTTGHEQQWVPWAALFLAPLARNMGLKVNLIDARVEPTKWVEHISALGPTDLLAVSVMTGHAIRDSVRASKIARNCGSKVIWGGPHVSLFPTETLEQAPVDAVISGFGYIPFTHLLMSVGEDKWPQQNEIGLLVKSTNTLDKHHTPSKYVQVPLDTLPRPYLDLVEDWAPYLNPDVAIASRTINLITSEGCTRSCTYCSEPRMSASTWLTRDLSHMVAVAKDLCARSGANGVKLHDPNFFHDMSRAQQFSRLFAEKISLPWAATMHPSDLDHASSNYLDQLASDGLVRVLVGLESPDPAIVRLAGKQYDPTGIPELAKKLAKARIRGMFTFIVGWPDADPAHYSRTIESAFGIRDIWEEHQAKIHFLEPWPGTPIYRLLSRRGFCFPQTLHEWANIDYYQAKYAMIHDPERLHEIRNANRRLSPYVNA